MVFRRPWGLVSKSRPTGLEHVVLLRPCDAEDYLGCPGGAEDTGEVGNVQGSYWLRWWELSQVRLRLGMCPNCVHSLRLKKVKRLK